MKRTLHALAALTILASAHAARATPSTVVWTPATTYTQPFLVPHLTYDTYFTSNAGYPVTTGVTVGVLPSDVVQAEVGFDLLFPRTPADSPLYFNGKLTLVEDKLFAMQPGLSVGVANAGVTDATNLAMVYGVLGKTIPGVGGSVAVGVAYGLDSDLWVDADGEEDRTSFLASVASPAFKVGKPWLDSVALGADLQTGSNIYSAAGLAASFYFTPTVSILTGPVFFLEEKLQPGGAEWMWTVQLDLDLPGLVN